MTDWRAGDIAVAKVDKTSKRHPGFSIRKGQQYWVLATDVRPVPLSLGLDIGNRPVKSDGTIGRTFWPCVHFEKLVTSVVDRVRRVQSPQPESM